MKEMNQEQTLIYNRTKFGVTEIYRDRENLEILFTQSLPSNSSLIYQTEMRLNIKLNQTKETVNVLPDLEKVLLDKFVTIDVNFESGFTSILYPPEANNLNFVLYCSSSDNVNTMLYLDSGEYAISYESNLTIDVDAVLNCMLELFEATFYKIKMSNFLDRRKFTHILLNESEFINEIMANSIDDSLQNNEGEEFNELRAIAERKSFELVFENIVIYQQYRGTSVQILLEEKKRFRVFRDNNISPNIFFETDNSSLFNSYIDYQRISNYGLDLELDYWKDEARKSEICEEPNNQIVEIIKKDGKYQLNYQESFFTHYTMVELTELSSIKIK